jgi:hypothetical protein
MRVFLLAVLLGPALLAQAPQSQTAAPPQQNQGNWFSSPDWYKSMPKIWTFQQPKGAQLVPSGTTPVWQKAVGLNKGDVTCSIPLLNAKAAAEFHGDPKMSTGTATANPDPGMVKNVPAPACDTKR